MIIFKANVEKTKDINFMGDLCPKFVILSAFLQFGNLGLTCSMSKQNILIKKNVHFSIKG